MSSLFLQTLDTVTTLNDQTTICFHENNGKLAPVDVASASSKGPVKTVPSKAGSNNRTLSDINPKAPSGINPLLEDQKLVFYGYYFERDKQKVFISLIFHTLDNTVEGWYSNAHTSHDEPRRKFLTRIHVPALPNLQSLQMNQPIEIFGKSVILFRASKETRQRMEEEYGIILAPDATAEGSFEETSETNEPEETTRDEFHGMKSTGISRYIEASRGATKHSTKHIKKFYNKKVPISTLFFVAQWRKDCDAKDENDDIEVTRDDETSQNLFQVRYYLETNEMEIYSLELQTSSIQTQKFKSQQLDSNQGFQPLLFYDPSTQNYKVSQKPFLRRMWVPKVLDNLHDDRARSCEIMTYQDDYLSPLDLRVGTMVNILNRSMAILDCCDEPTRRWYKETLGIDQPILVEPVLLAPDHRKKLKRTTKLLVQQRQRFTQESGNDSGSDDWYAAFSAANEPKETYQQFLTHSGRKSFYVAKLSPLFHPGEEHRIFRITCFHDGPEVSIIEAFQPNGNPGGPFLVKCKIEKENGKITHREANRDQLLSEDDFKNALQNKAALTIKAHHFDIISFDGTVGSDGKLIEN
jgi:DUF1126 PH-like domain